MSKQDSQSVHRIPGSARDVLLAGIGAASLLRRNAATSLGEAMAVMGRLPHASSMLLGGISERSSAIIGDEVDELIAVVEAQLRSDGVGEVWTCTCRERGGRPGRPT